LRQNESLPSKHDLLIRIERAIADSTATARARLDEGPFRLLLDPERDVVFVNYAAPIKPLNSPREEITKLIAAFRFHNRTPRLEFAKELWPDIEEPLILAGFKLTQTLPMMACARYNFRPRTVPGLDIRLMGPKDDVRLYYRTANEAFEMQWPVSESAIPKSDADKTTGPLQIALAYVQGECAGCACLSGIWELSGVGTRPRFRRRGIASAVSSYLLKEHFKTNDLAWLAADDKAAEAVYGKLGFEHVGTHVSWILT
jgi:GNAT superfamily N-acetyltransferase